MRTPAKSLASRASIVVSLALGALVPAGCGSSGAGNVFVTADWQLRCPSTLVGCVMPPRRGVDGQSGMGGVSASCTVTTRGDLRNLNFSMSQSATDRTSRVSGEITVATGGGSAQTGTITVNEDNDYRGSAGAAAPTDLQPCQVSGIEFVQEEETGQWITSGNILCRGMFPRADPSIVRDLTAAGADSAMHFEIYNCRGLSN